jgi:hypothetical protein
MEARSNRLVVVNYYDSYSSHVFLQEKSSPRIAIKYLSHLEGGHFFKQTDKQLITASFAASVPKALNHWAFQSENYR